MKEVIESLALLTPFDIDIRKRRIGPKSDGGYVFADNIRPGQTILSYGIDGEYRFDEIMAASGHPVYMFDHTIDSVNITNSNMFWYREGVDGTTNREASLYSIEDHLEKYGLQGNDHILKMDVEGYEYPALGMVSQATIGRFSQIVLEVHDIPGVGRDVHRTYFNTMMHNLLSQFTIFHVHANNCDGQDLFVVNGIPVPGILELSLIRTDLVNRTKSRTLYPTEFDFPNVGRPDKLLWFFPFMPSHLDAGEFVANDEQMTASLSARS